MAELIELKSVMVGVPNPTYKLAILGYSTEDTVFQIQLDDKDIATYDSSVLQNPVTWKDALPAPYNTIFGQGALMVNVLQLANTEPKLGKIFTNTPVNPETDPKEGEDPITGSTKPSVTPVPEKTLFQQYWGVVLVGFVVLFFIGRWVIKTINSTPKV